MKQNLTAGGFVGHTENGKAIGAFNVKNIAILRVRDVAIIIAWYLVQYLPRNRACVCHRRTKLR